MSTQELRDRNNIVIGRITTLSNGKMEIRDKANVLKGTYNPRTNETRDRANIKVGHGNLLTTLL
jgi:hypothetical protein